MAVTRVGLIGLGMAVEPHARSLLDLKDEVEVAAAYSPTPQRRDAFHLRTGWPVADSAEFIFGDPSIDMVMILTPPNTHLELVERAAGAGKHILLEKPLEITLERAKRLVETAERAKVKLGVVLQHRFRPVSLALRGIIEEGRLGALVSGSARLSNWRPQSYYDEPGRGTYARDGGGVLLTQGIHTLDLLVSLAGLPVEVSGYATTSPVHAMEAEDLAFAAVRFENGALGAIGATTSAYPGFPDFLEIIGTNGTARIESGRLAVQFNDGESAEATDGSESIGAGSDPMAFPHQHHRAVLQDFVSAIREGREPKVSGREALKVHRLIDAILRAARSGRRESV
ncbi:MAG: Gfo/Idh/MocA family oxidoreductase [Rhizobiaceae bacterium]|nr:Gfo/Idh/MocA family oxidoreductase [Rhizobiaceae bacterium]